MLTYRCSHEINLQIKLKDKKNTDFKVLFFIIVLEFLIIIYLLAPSSF